VTDDRLREAERIFRETGDVSAETRLLLERVRAGTLAPERLELAAELGYEPAVLATDAPAILVPRCLHETFLALERFGTEVFARAALVVTRRDRISGEKAEEARIRVQAVEAWLACPCERHRAAVEELADRSDPRAAFLVTLIVSGLRRYADLGYSGLWPISFEALLVQEVRSELLRWALAPHEPVERRGASRGEVLELTFGRTYWPGQHEVLTDANVVAFGNDPDRGVDVGTRGPGFAIARIANRFLVHAAAEESPVYVGLEAVKGMRGLATGDQLSYGQNWFSVRILAPPYAASVARAVAEADTLVRRLDEPLVRPCLGFLARMKRPGATLAAIRIGLPLRPSDRHDAWLEELAALPPTLAVAAALPVAREVLPIWSREASGETVAASLVSAIERWLEDPTEVTQSFVRSRHDRLGRILERRSRTVHGDNLAQRAGDAILSAADCIRGAESIKRVEANASRAGVEKERVSTLMGDGLLRWALG